MLVTFGLLKKTSRSCEAAVLESPSDKEVHQDDAQHGAPKAIPQRLPSTATPPPAEYYEKLKGASNQQAQLDSPAIDMQSLMKMLGSKDKRQRVRAFQSIAKAGPKATVALPKLREILRQEDSHEKTLALRCIAEIGPGAADAVPQLHALLKDKEKHFMFRMYALLALHRIGPEAEVVIPTLINPAKKSRRACEELSQRTWFPLRDGLDDTDAASRR